jgi:hypothetical protein
MVALGNASKHRLVVERIYESDRVFHGEMVTDFRQEYRKLSDGELLELASERASLLNEASTALDNELLSRGLKEPELASHQHRLNQHEQREAKKRLRKLLGKKQAEDSWADTFVRMYWSVVAIAVIWVVYLALPSRYHFSPGWQQAAEYVLVSSLIIVAVTFRVWFRKLAFWVALLISSFAHGFILHAWIIHMGSNTLHRFGERLALLLGLVLFALVYGCGYFLRRKIYGETQVQSS